MDFNKFDNDAETSDEAYSAFVEWLSARTVEELRHIRGEPEKQKQALCRYYKRGDHADLTPSELIDFLAVSTPSILDKAGYNDEEIDALMEISDHLNCKEINDISLPEVEEALASTSQLTLFGAEE